MYGGACGTIKIDSHKFSFDFPICIFLTLFVVSLPYSGLLHCGTAKAWLLYGNFFLLKTGGLPVLFYAFRAAGQLSWVGCS